VNVVGLPSRQTARWVGLVYGAMPPHDDPAEAYHEASKVSPNQIGRQIEGARRLDASVDLQISTTRSVKRLGRPVVVLPPASRPGCTLWDAISARRSQRAFGADAIEDEQLAAVLHAAYGVTHLFDSSEANGGRGLPLRSVPSGGALYPLELYVATLRVNGLDAGLYHFDPLRPGLETVRTRLAPQELAGLSTYPEIVDPCAALILIAAVFGRTRFKYGLRSYRFTLLEAGHVGQNVLLAAAALGLGAVPLGGFYDRLTDEFLGLDGVNESALYTIALGRVPAGP
jgi:SagB-type dehydrogenase family enzyme